MDAAIARMRRRAAQKAGYAVNDRGVQRNPASYCRKWKGAAVQTGGQGRLDAPKGSKCSDSAMPPRKRLTAARLARFNKDRSPMAGEPTGGAL